MQEWTEAMRSYIKAVFGRIMADVKEYGAAAVTVGIYAVTVNLVFHAFCPLVIFCGFPCPGCGVSRATVCALTGRWQQAWQLNPVVFPIILFAVYFFWNRYLLGRKAKGVKTLIVMILALLFAVYCVRMFCCFPGRVPFVYTEHNILAHIFPFYQQMLHESGII